MELYVRNIMVSLVGIFKELSEHYDRVIDWNIYCLIQTFVGVICNLIYEVFRIRVISSLI